MSLLAKNSFVGFLTPIAIGSCNSNLTGIYTLNVSGCTLKNLSLCKVYLKLFFYMKLTVILRQYEESGALLLSSYSQYNRLGAALASGGVHPGSVQVARGQSGQLEPDVKT